tara:strand:- start:2121 stop:2507 length:387 start_codon:yes stop_codon:yes gene_type:complete
MFGLFGKKSPAVTAEDLVEKLFPQLITQVIETTTGHEPGLLERVEAMERRFEALHTECLRYLQRGSKAAERASKLREQHEEEIDNTEVNGYPTQIELDAPPQAEQPVETDLEYIERQIRDGGGMPITE